MTFSTTPPPARLNDAACWYSGDSKQADPLFERRELDHDEPVEVVRSFIDLVAAASRENPASVTRDDRRYEIRVFCTEPDR